MSDILTLEEIADIVEQAIHSTEWKAGKRPSVEDLEKMLLADDKPPIRLMPDGSITSVEPRKEAYKAAADIHPVIVNLACKAQLNEKRAETAEQRATQAEAERDAALDALTTVEACMSMIAPRNEKRRYLETLDAVRAVIRTQGKAGA